MLACCPRICWVICQQRWLLGTHHGTVGRKHLPAYLDERVFRYTARKSHRFARLVEQAVATKPVTYQAIVATLIPA